MPISTPTPLELLAPAKNADIGIEAIRHGADAVYIGAAAFGARAAAGNQIADIKRLVDYAHLFGAKVYVTVNTIVYDHELKAVEELITTLYDIGVDALIVQDMAIARLNLPPIPLHASTQMDNRTPQKVRALHQLGYEQVVLARELSLDEISDIHRQCPDVRLEAFCHGALCVSYSGQCFVSQHLFGRSANRGECAQVCRMEFDLENEKGDKLVRGKHLLSLKDLCQIDCLEQMAEAGVTSFKIEGRLKDMGYVKNVTAAYARKLDELVGKYPEKYRRASRGTVRYFFQPDVAKSFNRGFTHYFLLGKNDDIFAFDTPKAIGKPVGRIGQLFSDHLVVEQRKPKDAGASVRPDKAVFSNGDGLCCMASDGKLIGFRVNRAEGDSLYPLRMPSGLRRGMRLYRNFDKRFEETLAGDSAERFIPVDIVMDYDRQSSVFILSMSEASGTDSLSESSRIAPSSGFSDSSGFPGFSGISGFSVSLRIPFSPELARSPQRDNILRQLSRLGNTPLRLENLDIRYRENFFIPSSLLSQWRRGLVELFLGHQAAKRPPVSLPQQTRPRGENTSAAIPMPTPIAANYNIANHLSRDFYEQSGVHDAMPAFELYPSADTPLMTCRHCIRYALGWCYKRQRDVDRPTRSDSTQNQPLFLALRNGVRLSLRFNCNRCLMTVHTITAVKIPLKG